MKCTFGALRNTNICTTFRCSSNKADEVNKIWKICIVSKPMSGFTGHEALSIWNVLRSMMNCYNTDTRLVFIKGHAFRLITLRHAFAGWASAFMMERMVRVIPLSLVEGTFTFILISVTTLVGKNDKSCGSELRVTVPGLVVMS